MISSSADKSLEKGHDMEIAEAYFDESGTDDKSDFICMAGYIFTKDNAAALDVKWKQMLESYGLPYFHMSECAHNTGIYKHLTRQQCAEAQAEAIELTKQYASKGIAISLDKSAYPLIANNGIWSSPYSFLCGQVFYGVRDWAKETEFAGTVNYFFESGVKEWRKAAREIERFAGQPVAKEAFRFQDFSPLGKADATPLQCADLLAWHWNTYNKRLQRGEKKKREDFKNLIGLKIDPHHYDKERILGWNAIIGATMAQLARKEPYHGSLTVLTDLI